MSSSLKFSLYADWGCEAEKKCEKKIFYLPVSDKVPLKTIKIEGSKMVIEVDKSKFQTQDSSSGKEEHAGPGLQPKKVDAGSIVASGVTSIVGGKVTAVGKTFLKMNVKEFFQSLCDKVPWFQSWKKAEKIPVEIRYEGLENVVKKENSVIGEKVGGSEEGGVLAGGGWGLGTPGEKISISIYYDGQKPMNPVEFFSLLFWQEEYDPIYQGKRNEESEKYEFGGLDKYKFESWGGSKTHPLINLMMKSTKDGKEGSPKNDDWIGLRPPLRTYKRVEWEAKRELALYFDRWQRGDEKEAKTEKKGRLVELDDKGDVKVNRIKTPDIEINIPSKGNPGYVGYSKCNIFAGEMAYRSGFKTFVAVGRSKSGKNKFLSPDELVKASNPGFGKRMGNTQIDNIDQIINDEIKKRGKCIIYARPQWRPKEEEKDLIGHVVILKEISKLKKEEDFDHVEATVIDQHCNSESNFGPRKLKGNAAFRLISSPSGKGVFIELEPNDDPEWL